MKITRKGYYTITGPDGVLLEREAGKVLQVTSRDECYERITEDGREGIFTIQCPNREVLRTNLSNAQVMPVASSFKLDATSYSIDENDTVQFKIQRGGDLTRTA